MSLYLTGASLSGDTLLAISSTASQNFAYSPFGSVPPESIQDVPLPGFNGERPDPLSGLCGVTHLGNGYRTYSPTLMRFICPDSESPFGAGGINPYMYCSGDPINASDPSGHLLWELIFGAIAGAKRAGTAAAAAAASDTATWVSIGSSVGSQAFNIAAAKTSEDSTAHQALTSTGFVFGISGGLLGLVGNVSFVVSHRAAVKHVASSAAHHVEHATEGVLHGVEHAADGVLGHHHEHHGTGTLGVHATSAASNVVPSATPPEAQIGGANTDGSRGATESASSTQDSSIQTDDAVPQGQNAGPSDASSANNSARRPAPDAQRSSAQTHTPETPEPQLEDIRNLFGAADSDV
jgi:RHS repeat-associated protein